MPHETLACDPVTQQTRHLAALNAQQHRAATHANARADEPSPALLIVAGAGTGKTNTLAHRIAHLVVTGAHPERILLLTFSRRAAVEMQHRVARVLREAKCTTNVATLSWSGTFHSVGARLLREYAPRIGLDPQFTIQDRGDSEDLIGLVRHELRYDGTAERFPSKATCLAIYSRCVNSEDSLPSVLGCTFTWCAPWESELRALFGAYVEAKQANHVLDFDDLLLYWSHMAGEGTFAKELGARFDHILVDEYQDTNRLQSRVLLAMKPTGEGVTVVGDDAQAIYSFRAANVRNILEFPGYFEPPATVVVLERNYRSTQGILDASNAVIGQARERFTKDLWSERVSAERPQLVTVNDETAQAQFVADNILALREAGDALRSQAVLFRAGAHAAQLEFELARRRIPYVKYGGLRFLEVAHVKDVLSLLRFAENPRARISGFRALQLVRGIGPATATSMLAAIADASEIVAVLAATKLPHVVSDDWMSFIALVSTLRRDDDTWPGAIDAALQWYEPQLERLYDDAAARRSDLAGLAAIARTYPSCERFLTELTLDPPSAVSDEAQRPSRDDDYVVLSTIHSAKGQEWKSVHVLNVVDGCIPSDMATGSAEEVEEERRLLYVAMTRAKDRLYLLVPQRFYVTHQAAQGDRHVYASRSRFVPDAMERLFECRAWPEPKSDTTHLQVAESAPAVDLAARLRQAWQ
ncbi:MAG: ATP-dependent helicase [Pseudomonadota bacterium]|nr:ATP-dependent helicase [Pseudomonadota bacterium]